MAENRIRLRKRDRWLSGPVHFDETYGHTTAGGGMDTYNSNRGSALSFSRREWVEDVNHRQHYTLRVIGDDPNQYHTATLIGTMTTADRGGPLWVRRIERRWPRSSIASSKDVNGVPTPGQGNWSVVNWGMSQITGPNSQYTTNNPVVPVFGNVPSKSSINFDYWSPKGWAKFKPTNPAASTSQFLAELRDFPRIPFRLFERAKFFRSIGKEYLNFEFGWKPFVKDLIEFFKLYLSWNERWQWLIANNGKPVHRKGAIFKDEDTTSDYTISGDGVDWNTPVGPTWVYVQRFGSGSGFKSTRTTVIRTSQKYWFSGTFRYYLKHPGFTRFYDEQIARIVFGVDLTPRVVYELLPWSWLLDWATNVGDNLDNLTDSILDGLVADYAYTMGHYMVEETRTVVGPLATCNYYLTNEVKARDQATPYGFGLNPNSFTGRQKAILAALLLARS